MIQTKSHRKYLFTPLRYPGGKTSLFEYFDKIIKDNGWRDVIYVEPYAGGAGAALSLLLLGKVHSIIINDKDPAIYAFWDSILNNTDEFIGKIQNTELNIMEWEKQQKIYRAADTSDMLSLGFATFYLNRTNRSGVLNAGPIGGKRQDGEWKMNARYNKRTLIDRIKLISLYRDRISVSKNDGIEIIEKYADSPNVFMYIDPPYFVKGANLYLNAFKQKHHKELANVLNAHSNAKWVLTYDNEVDIRELYSARRQEAFLLRYSIHQNSKVGSELMIFSDAIDVDIVDGI